ncbi:MAG: DUF3131 domain-containing protein [Chitinophagaceae bacterium]|nr:MAG: DUF3131 domain-containing protein [Chitinophagaceae bacterium]
MSKFNANFLIKPVFFIVCLLLAVHLVLWLEQLKPSDFGFYRDIFTKEVIIQKRAEYPLREPKGTLSEQEMEFARIAWTYFENNYHEETGFVNSVQDYPAATLWDLTSYMLGMISAYEIGIIDSFEFDNRLTTYIQSLSEIQLYRDKLPNKVYNAISLQMVDYADQPTEMGVGWSALDIGRFFSFVNKVVFDYPAYHSLLRNAIGHWQIDKMIDKATMYGLVFNPKDGQPMSVQEGKLGYEQYCARGLMMAGYDVSEAMKYTDFLRFVRIFGEDIAVDTREIRRHPAHNYILSEPYMLDGIEYGWDFTSRELAYRVYKVQKERYKRTGIITAVSEDHVDESPYFVYNCVYADGKTWVCVAENGDDADEFRSLSTKAAISWYVLYEDDYSDVLLNAVKNLYDPERGWYSGRYEKTGEINTAITANTNGIILTALNYLKNGRVVGFK